MQSPSPGKGDPAYALLAWGSPTAPGCTWLEGSRLSQAGGVPLTPCSWCPLPWVGLQALSHGSGGGAGLTLFPSIQAVEEILEGEQERRPWSMGVGRRDLRGVGPPGRTLLSAHLVPVSTLVSTWCVPPSPTL